MSNGKKVLASTGFSEAYIWTFDAATGNVLSKQAMKSQWDTYLAPTADAGAAYTESGQFSGMSKIDLASGAIAWSNTSLPLVQTWTPAVASGRAWTRLDATLFEIDSATGQVLSTIADPYGMTNEWEARGAVVLDRASAAYSAQIPSSLGHMTKFNRSSKRVDWSVRGGIQEQSGTVGQHAVLRKQHRTSGTLNGRRRAIVDVEAAVSARDYVVLRVWHSQLHDANPSAALAGGWQPCLCVHRCRYPCRGPDNTPVGVE
jgi:hypothetical protein